MKRYDVINDVDSIRSYFPILSKECLSYQQFLGCSASSVLEWTSPLLSVMGWGRSYRLGKGVVASLPQSCQSDCGAYWSRRRRSHHADQCHCGSLGSSVDSTSERRYSQEKSHYDWPWLSLNSLCSSQNSRVERLEDRNSGRAAWFREECDFRPVQSPLKMKPAFKNSPLESPLKAIEYIYVYVNMN